MRFFSTLALAASGLASMVAAQTANGPLYFTWIVPASVQVGQTYNVSYAASSLSSPVEIILREGSSADLDTIATLTSSATGGSYQWTVSKDLPNGAGYALQIKQGSDINYSKQFAIAGSSAVASSAASSASASGSSAASMASAASSGASSAASSAASTGSVTTSSHSSATSGASSTGSRTSSATGATAPTGAASNIKSPMALIFGAVAAMAYLQ